MPDILIHALDGSDFPAYTALPAGGHGAGLILIHDMFGLSPTMRALCDDYAALGYVVVCPNLYARQLLANGQTSQNFDMDEASKLYKNFDVEAGVRDLLATLAHIRNMPACGGKVGALGLCLGGRMAFLMAARSDVDCVVAYDNVGLESLLDEIYDVRMPTLMHFGEQDVLMTPTARQMILAALKKNEKIVSRLYSGADHGFALAGGAKYQAEAAAQAKAATDSFLAENLKV